MSAGARPARPGLLSRARWKRLQATDCGLIALLVAFACLAATYSVVTPLYEAPDEMYHYPFVRYLAEGHGLPVQDPQNPGPWHQEGSQPPLYYFLASLASRWAPAADLDQVLPPYPHAAIGLVRPDGHANAAIHTPAEAFPYHGAVLAIHLARGLSVLLATLTVLFTYALGREVLPKRPGLALAAAALAAFTPMFAFIAGSVNNDNLVTALATASLWLTLRATRRAHSLRGWALLGGVIGLAALAKVSALGLLVPAGLALAWVVWQRRDLRTLLLGGACLGVAFTLVAGWWYVRNWRLYGDPLGWNVFLSIARLRPYPPSLRELAAELPGLFKTYWGVFGWVNVIAPAGFYRFCAALTALGAGGVVVALVRRLLARRRVDGATAFRLGLLALWPVIVLVGLIRWTSLTTASQGRLLFPAIGSLSFLLVLGLCAWGQAAGDTAYCVLRKVGLSKARPKGQGYALRITRYGLCSVAIVLLAAFALWFPFGVIRPAYAPPRYLTPTEVAAIPQQLDLTFGDRLELLGYAMDGDKARPGDAVTLTLYWRAQAAMDSNYSIFVHLVDSNGIKIAQRDVYPGGGALPTSLWQAGEAIADRYVIQVPADTFSPNQLSFVVGVYSLETGARLPVRDGGGREVGDSARFGEVRVPARPEGSIPNPVHYNLGNEFTLAGYDLDRTALHAGDTLKVTLYWQAPAPLAENCSAFVRLCDSSGRAWTGTGWPLASQPATETRNVVLPPDMPPGEYYVQAGAYRAGSLEPLPTLDARGQAQEGSCTLTRIVVLPGTGPEPAASEPQHSMDVTLGGVARLVGFTVDQETVNPYEPLRLTLYWQAAGGAVEGDYKVFAHLLDAQGRVIAQHDGLPDLGRRPVASWTEGETIVDPHHLSFSEVGYRGEAVLEVGLYDPQTMARLATPDGEDRVILPVRVMVQP